MMQRESSRIDEQRKNADRVFDGIDLDIVAFQQELGRLMTSGEYQALSKIMQADQDVSLVTRENEAFVQWLEEHEETSIPWMKRVLKALSLAHDDKVEEDKKKWVLSLAHDDKVEEDK